MSSYPQAISSITNDNWQILAHSTEHKANLLTYAKECGVPVAPESWGHATDKDLYLSFLSDKTGIISLPNRHKYRTTTLITGPDFFMLCSQYAQGKGLVARPVDEANILTPTPYSA